MHVLIKLEYMSWGGIVERKGAFPVNSGNFAAHGDLAVAEIAYRWIRNIMIKEHPVNEVVKVTYDREHDITELVKQKLNRWEMDLPF